MAGEQHQRAAVAGAGADVAAQIEELEARGVVGEQLHQLAVGGVAAAPLAVAGRRCRPPCGSRSRSSVRRWASCAIGSGRRRSAMEVAESQLELAEIALPQRDLAHTVEIAGPASR